MTYYKVVRRTMGGPLVSAIVDPSYTDFYRVYRSNGENLKVKNGMAFTSKWAAENFVSKQNSLRSLEIWTCQGRKISLPRMLFDLHFASRDPQKALQLIKNILFHGAKRTQYADLIWRAPYALPAGTIRLRDLKLKEQVS